MTQVAGYLAEVAPLLWPPPATATLTGRRAAARRRTASGDRCLAVLPGPARPRLLVPTGRRPGAAAIRGYGEPGSARTRLATRTLRTLLAAGLGPLIGGRLIVAAPAGAVTIESYLTELVGQPVQISMHLGAPRANRKPVLQLLSPAGRIIGFAKVGVGPLTAELVQAEHASLNRLAELRPPGMAVPSVLASGTWNGQPVLVLDPLPVWRKRRPLPPGRLQAVLAELATLAGTTTGPLAGSGYWQRLVSKLDQAEPSEDRGTLTALLPRLAKAAGAERVTFGCWHGDLTPWNLASTRAGLLVWDWERFSCDVPVGYDALHYWLQTQVSELAKDPADAASRCVARSAALLEPFGVPAAAARLTALGYLAELSVRYLADRQAAAGARLGAPGRWLLPAIEQGLRQWPTR